MISHRLARAVYAGCANLLQTGDQESLPPLFRQRIRLFNMLNLISAVVALVLAGMYRFIVLSDVLWMGLLLAVLLGNVPVFWLQRQHRYQAAVGCAFFLIHAIPLGLASYWIHQMALPGHLYFDLQSGLIFLGMAPFCIFFFDKRLVQAIAVGINVGCFLSIYLLVPRWLAPAHTMLPIEQLELAVKGATAYLFLLTCTAYSKRLFLDYQRRLVQKQRRLRRKTRQLRDLNKTKDLLFGIISHDLREPVSQLQATLQLLNESVGQPARVEALLPGLTRRTNHVAHTLDNLLHWSNGQIRGATVRPTVLIMSDLADDVLYLLQDLAVAKHLTLVNAIPPTLTAYADEPQLTAVLRNLLHNAIKFTPDGGRIVIGGQLGLTAVRLWVIDTGIGMDAPTLAQLFSTSTNPTRPGTNHEAGVGLGLILSRELVQRQGGHIWAESEPGRGSTFWFTLPGSEPLQHSTESTTPNSPVHDNAWS
jgi:signal transduction histidine kinase